MNVYTHVAMEDLVRDIEAIPSGPLGDSKELLAEINNQIVEQSTSLPAELAVLADNWSNLPEHIRQAIGILARS